MKLTKELKQRIDSYFEKISAEELYKLAVTKYDFSEIIIDVEDMKFQTVEKSVYHSKYVISYNEKYSDESNYNLLIA